MRIVIKAGTDVLTNKGKLRQKVIKSLVSQMAKLHQKGHQIIFVTSGAVACGQRENNQADGDIISKSRAAMRGQPRLMFVYQRFFKKFEIEVAQALYTYTDLKENAEFIATNLIRGFRDKELTIVNFDDACADTELIAMGTFGDNDILAAMITNLIKADLLIILTSTSGLWDGPPDKPESRFIPEVEKVTADILELAQTDGMRQKLKAAQMVQEAGSTCIIANGFKKDILLKIIKGEKEIGTFFLPINLS